MRTRMLSCVVLGFLSALSFAQAPVPFLNQPLAPAATAPGGPQFTLTISGTGFVLGTVVHWNSDSLVTSFVNGSQVTATVPAAEITTASTAWISAVNPGPGGGTSNVVSFPITIPTLSIAMNRVDIATGVFPSEGAVADLNGDGKLDLIISNYESGTVSVFLGNGDGTFRARVDYAVGRAPSSVVVGDFNRDGKLDLAVRNQSGSTISILLGNGDGTFQKSYDVPSGNGGSRMVAGDFNGDGNLDLANTNVSDGTVSILLGNGDGTFQKHVDYPVGGNVIAIAAGDLNGDGKLDLVVGYNGTSEYTVLLGKGDGTFEAGQSYPSLNDIQSFVVADFDGDGKLDMAVFNSTGQNPGIEILLGNGDGTFRNFAGLATGCGDQTNDCSAAGADMNGDGKLDLVVRNSPGDEVQVLLGNGDGTFQAPIYFATGSNPEQVIVGDFNGDGLLDLVVPNLLSNSISLFLQQTPGPTAMLSKSSLSFGAQLHNTASPIQSVTLTNTGSATLDLTSIAASANFFEGDNCGSSLLPGAACRINVDFFPGPIGIDAGSLTITDNAPNSPQTVALSGIGTVVTLSATSLNFGSQAVGTTSAPQTITLTNHSKVRAVPIYNVLVKGSNFLSFGQTNTCGVSVVPEGSCTLSVTFTPKEIGGRKSTLYLWTGGGDTPEAVTLSGDGT